MLVNTIMSVQTAIQSLDLHTLGPHTLDIRKHIEAYSTLEWLQAREHNMTQIKQCIAPKHLCHVENIDIGVGEEVLLCDMSWRVKIKSALLAGKTGNPSIEFTDERMRGLMTSNPQFCTDPDLLCPAVEDIFCACLHAMVYATVDIMDQRSSLPSVDEMVSNMKASPSLHGAEVRSKALAVKVLAAAYSDAREKKLLVRLPSANRAKVLDSLTGEYRK